MGLSKTQLTRNFSLEELTRTGTMLPNVPNAEQAINLTLLAVNVLQPIRDLSNSAIYINSGFRSPAVNEEVNGKFSSQHLKGQAADITSNALILIYTKIIDLLDYDQCILYVNKNSEPLFIHISFELYSNRKSKWIEIRG